MNVDIQLSLLQKSDRVKCADYHPTEPWVLLCMFSGKVIIFDTEKNEIRNHFEPGYQPIRCGRFIARKQWVVFGCDDLYVRVYNYNTGEKIKEWKAHDDFIRGLDVNETYPYILTCGDDMLIKMWDWEKDFELVRRFEGHSYYIMGVKFNPKDSSSFASVSLDRSIKIWSINSSQCNYSLVGHKKGVNCVDFYPGSDKPYIITGSDDFTVKVWDYQTKTCIQTLNGHEANVNCVIYHPRLPYILSCGEDGKVIIFHNNTYKKEREILQPSLDRTWTISACGHTNCVVFGYDEGYCVYRMGKNIPTISMDSQGRVIWCRRQEMWLSQPQIDNSRGYKGDEIPMTNKEISFVLLGRCEVTPAIIQHNHNGRFIAIVGEGEYVVYTSRQLRSKAYGEGTHFVWRQGGNSYCVQINESTLKCYDDFKEKASIQLPSPIKDIYGGTCIGVNVNNESVWFYDWEKQTPIRHIDGHVNCVRWNEQGDRVAIHTTESLFILEYKAEGTDNFTVLHEIPGCSTDGLWYNKAYIYILNSKIHVNINNYHKVISFVPTGTFILNYIPGQNLLYCVDSKYHLHGYSINSAVLEYECAIGNEDIEGANRILPTISVSEYNEVANYLHSCDYIEYACQLVQDPAVKFNYALELEDIEICRGLLVNELNVEKESIYNNQRWRQLADCCILKGELKLAEECAKKAEDFSLLLLLYTCTGNRQGLQDLGKEAVKADQWNVAFTCFYLIQDVTACRELLQQQELLPQAAFFTLSHQPSCIQDVFKNWQDDLIQHHHIAAELIANPGQYSEFFPGYHEALQLEESIRPLYSMDIEAGEYSKYKEMLENELCLNELKCVGEVNETTGEQCEDNQVVLSVEEETEEPVNSDIMYTAESIPSEIITDSPEPDDEFDEIEEGSIEGDVDDIDIEDLEKEWE